MSQPCGCDYDVTGRCWLAVNRIWKARNSRLLVSDGNVLSSLAFAEAEARRLKALAADMERRGVTRLSDVNCEGQKRKWLQQGISAPSQQR
jgi:hypothetical protein